MADREWGWGTLWTGVTGVTRKAEARHFHDAEQRLRVLQRQDDTWDGANFSAAGVWEEYRYDPLGRRVMVRTRRESGLCADPGRVHESPAGHRSHVDEAKCLIHGA